MTFEEIIEKLGENPIEQSKETVRIILKIVENIIAHPNDDKLRQLKKSNETIAKKILCLTVGPLCLKLMGFEEDSTSFKLPKDAKLLKLHEVKDTLLMWRESLEISDATDKQKVPTCSSTTERKRPSIDLSKNEAWNQDKHKKVQMQSISNIKPIVLPPLITLFKNPFLHHIEVQFHQALQYENKDLQERTKNIIPVQALEKGAQQRLRLIQEHVKKDKLKEPDFTIQDMLILELLQWFKEDFFTWVDSPPCESCGGETSFSFMSQDKKHLVYTNRVEMHRCDSCHEFTPFPRYNDLNILLETRRGRCGEWANTFTMMCRAMGWDARFVVDEGDHVWTEVYSIGQKRWLHCDPCENICDKPLIYESGWKKPITYVIAYSGDEVQDVTWRYSSRHKEVLKARNKCSERELIDCLIKLRSIRQETYSKPKKTYLTKRLLLELLEFMTEKKADEDEKKGRQSGDAMWRLMRGEGGSVLEENCDTKFVWKINPEQSDTNTVTVRYSTARNCYELLVDNEVRQRMDGWQAGVFSYRNILRKEERDWKQVYLARQSGNEEGSILWSFEIEDGSKKLHDVIVTFSQNLFENGSIMAKASTDDAFQLISKDEIPLRTNRFAGKKNITVTAVLSGGKGDVAWQHAQLFRQPMASKEFPFSLTFIFK